MFVLMRIWAIAFLVTGIVFAAARDYIPNYITNIGVGLFNWHQPQTQYGEDRFWVVLSVALLFVLAYLCAIVQHSVVRNIGYTRPVILAKIVSTIGFVVCFFTIDRQFMYLVGALVDGTICVFTWYFYVSALRSRA